MSSLDTTMQESTSLPLPADNDQNINSWSWGGSLAFMYLACAAKRWGLLVLAFITMIIPIVNFIALIGFFIYGGLRGKAILYSSPRYTNHDQKMGAIKALEMVGGLIGVMIMGAVVVTLAFLSFGAFFGLSQYAQDAQQAQLQEIQKQQNMQMQIEQALNQENFQSETR